MKAFILKPIYTFAGYDDKGQKAFSVTWEEVGTCEGETDKDLFADARKQGFSHPVLEVQ